MTKVNPYFSFSGMQRSGNHAIINWWLQHFDSWHFKKNILDTNYRDKCGKIYNTTTNKQGSSHVFVDSWENYEPNDIVCNPVSTKLIVILRDPYNWWASLVSFSNPNDNLIGMLGNDVIALYLKYIEYARQHLDYFVNFNKWFSLPKYRRYLEKVWFLDESDEGLNSVSEMGGGSSFDGKSLDGKAQEMQVLTRYKQVSHLPQYYKPLRQYPELADISREFFDIEPPESMYSACQHNRIKQLLI